MFTLGYLVGLTAATQHGIFYGMKTTIDAAGRVVVPRKIRDAAQIEPGSELEVRLENGAIILEPAPVAVQLKRRGSLLVAQRESEGEPLTQETVNATLRAVRSERGETTSPKAKRR